MKATTMLIAASFVALAGVAATPGAVAASYTANVLGCQALYLNPDMTVNEAQFQSCVQSDETQGGACKIPEVGIPRTECLP